MKSILVLFFVVFLTLEAGLVNAVSIIVNNTPITLYQIDETANKMNISKKEAVDFLIDEKIQESEIKNLGIFVDDFEVDERIEAIARSNNLTKDEFKDILESKLISYKEYKEDLKKKIVQEKLARKIFSEESVSVDTEDALLYYKNNLKEFTVPKKIKISKYASKNRRALEAFLVNPLMVNPSIAVESETIETDTLNPKLISLVAETDEGSFTPILPIGSDVFVTILIEKKLESVQKDFDDVKNQIAEKLRQENESKSIQRYFKKQRSKAKIVEVRTP